MRQARAHIKVLYNFESGRRLA